ncbi:hypothetical protein L596_011302 [Steinernema carpocapsae]|uniref:Uncharacterized protein n=1 Tax=Steinernema carpocapsae TaxID=34508 RepID=A0A4U5NUC8_STECR|nr:hypothetical protein L596_011302 [Steinernema carpocapsae]
MFPRIAFRGRMIVAAAAEAAGRLKILGKSRRVRAIDTRRSSRFCGNPNKYPANAEDRGSGRIGEPSTSLESATLSRGKKWSKVVQERRGAKTIVKEATSN